MRYGRPSLTARAIAAARGQLSRPRSREGDAEVEERLCAEFARSFRIGGDQLFHYLVARTRFFDERTLAALAGGLAQVVIVGAGYDGRALRFRTTGVRFFELDHPVTQRDKFERLKRLGADLSHVSLVPADFTKDDVDAVLGAAGHDRTRGSLVVCEGLVIYLDRGVIRDLLKRLRRRASPDSILAIQLPIRSGKPWQEAQRAAFNVILSIAGEPPRTRFGPEEALELLRQTGWSPRSVVDPFELDNQAWPGHALLVSAVPT